MEKFKSTNKIKFPMLAIQILLRFISRLTSDQASQVSPHLYISSSHLSDKLFINPFNKYLPSTYLVLPVLLGIEFPSVLFKDYTICNTFSYLLNYILVLLDSFLISVFKKNRSKNVCSMNK